MRWQSLPARYIRQIRQQRLSKTPRIDPSGEQGYTPAPAPEWRGVRAVSGRQG